MGGVWTRMEKGSLVNKDEKMPNTFMFLAVSGVQRSTRAPGVNSCLWTTIVRIIAGHMLSPDTNYKTI